MGGWLKESTTQTIVLGPFLSDTDFKSPQTGLTITAAEVFLSKVGSVYAAKNESSALSPMGTGMYSGILNATDTNTTGRLDVFITESGALVVWDTFMVLPANVYDSLVGGTAYLNANVMAWYAAAITEVDTAGYPKVTIKDGTGAGEIDLTSGVVLAKDHAGANLATAAQGAAIQAKTDNLPSDPADQSLLTAQIAALENVSAADVKTQVVDALTVDTYAEPGQTAPPATTTILGRLQWIYKAWRNKVDQSGSQYKLYNDAGDTVDNKSALTDDSTVYQKGKVGSGP